MPHVMSDAEAVRVKADITVSLGILVPGPLFASNYKSNLYLSKDRVLDKEEDLLWTVLNSQGNYIIFKNQISVTLGNSILSHILNETD